MDPNKAEDRKNQKPPLISGTTSLHPCLQPQLRAGMQGPQVLGWGRSLKFAFRAPELEASSNPMPCFADEEMSSEKRNELPKLTLGGTGGFSLKQEGLAGWSSNQAGVLGGFL